MRFERRFGSAAALYGAIALSLSSRAKPRDLQFTQPTATVAWNATPSLSSRPERSVAEGPAVLRTFRGNVFRGGPAQSGWIGVAAISVLFDGPYCDDRRREAPGRSQRSRPMLALNTSTDFRKICRVWLRACRCSHSTRAQRMQERHGAATERTRSSTRRASSRNKRRRELGQQGERDAISSCTRPNLSNGRREPADNTIVSSYLFPGLPQRRNFCSVNVSGREDLVRPRPAGWAKAGRPATPTPSTGHRWSEHSRRVRFFVRRESVAPAAIAPRLPA